MQAQRIDVFHGTTTVVSSSDVDTGAVGTYTVTYTATDLDNNTATATRTANVTTAPVVVVAGDNPATVELGAITLMQGYSYDLSGDVTVVTSGEVDTATVGSYVHIYIN